MRNQREALTLASILVALIRVNIGRAADIAILRFKALERTSWDGHWVRAQYAELLEPEGGMLMDDDENEMLWREQRLHQKLSGKGNAEKG